MDVRSLRSKWKSEVEMRNSGMQVMEFKGEYVDVSINIGLEGLLVMKDLVEGNYGFFDGGRWGSHGQ